VTSYETKQLIAVLLFVSERIQEKVSAVEEKCDRRIELLAKSTKKTRKRARIERQEDEEEEWVPSVQLHAERVKVQVIYVARGGLCVYGYDMGY
jgi:hypothetical protein